MANSYANGNLVRVRAQIKDEWGTLTDATTVTITFTRPDATTTSPTVTHDSTGNYNAVVTTNQVGTWTYSSTSTGVVTVGSGTFTVT